MNGRVFLALVAVGLAVVGYAIFTLSMARTSPPVPADGPEKTTRTESAPKTRPPTKAPTVGPAKALAPEGTDKPDAEEPEDDEVTRLRKDLDDLFARMDEEIASGNQLESSEWTELYGEGQTSIQSLAKELGTGSDAVREISGYHKDLREKLDALGPKPPSP